MQTIKVLAMATVIVLAPIVAAAEVVVSHFEPLQQTLISKTDKSTHSFSAKPATSAAVFIQFDALGKSFELQLVPNERIESGLPAGVAKSEVEIYRGRLANNPLSWVRIVLFDGMPRGMIWDGTEMYAVESPGDSTLAIDAPVIYRLADAFVVSGTMSCGSDFLSGSAAAIMKEIGIASKTAITRANAVGAISEITMSAIGDYEFTNARGGDSAAVALITTRLNNVDGFFSEQVGVQIKVDLIETHADQADPFGDTLIASELLDELSEYRLHSSSHISRGLTHLYTGRNLDTTTVGIAWRGVLCEGYFGAGLSEGNSGATNDSLIAAHEIGHNFGAQHDGEAMTPCESDTGAFIMSTLINGSQNFSACSISIMQAEAASAACVAALPAVDVSIQQQAPVSGVLFGAQTDLTYQVASNGTLDAAGVQVTFSIPNVLSLQSVESSAGSCSNGGGVVSCDLGDMVGLSSAAITLSVLPNALGTGNLTANATTTDTDERPVNNQDSVLITVEPAVDLVAGSPMTTAVFIGASTSVGVSVSNASDINASNADATISLENGLQPVSASWSIGSCAVSGQQVRCLASTIGAQSSSTITVDALGVSSGSKDVTVLVSATQADINPADNSIVGELRVVDPGAQKDEGGGATSPVVLLLALYALLSTRRRQVRS